MCVCDVYRVIQTNARVCVLELGSEFAELYLPEDSFRNVEKRSDPKPHVWAINELTSVRGKGGGKEGPNGSVHSKRGKNSARRKERE